MIKPPKTGPSGDRISWASPTYDRLIRSATVPKELFQFTSDFGLIGIAKEEALFATHIGYLNDTAERLRGVEMVAEALRVKLANGVADVQEKEFLEQAVKYVALLKRVAPMTFLTSFAASESLQMYRLYAPPNEGHALKISGTRLALSAQRQRFQLLPCIYEPPEHEAIVDELVESLLDSYRHECQNRESLRRIGQLVPSPGFWFAGAVIGFANELVTTYAPVFKHVSFAAEHEWRLIKTLRGDSPDRPRSRKGIRGITPYIHLKLERGANLYPGTAHLGEHMLEIHHGPSGTEDQLREAATRMLFCLLSRLDREYTTLLLRPESHEPTELANDASG
jgi:hypothetical protein